MKLNISTTYLFVFFIFNSVILFSQANNCGDVEPILQCSMDDTFCLLELTDSPVITTNSTLPDLEYAIVDYTKPSTSGTGPSVVGFDIDGIFMPNDFNLTPGTNFGVIPFAYDLLAIQETLDDLLKGQAFPFPPISCCQAAAAQGQDICADLNAAGINCGSDVTSLQQASLLFGVGGGTGGDTLSIVDVAASIDATNTGLSDPNTPAACGGGDKIAYAYGAECTYFIVPQMIVRSMPHSMNETIEAEQTISSSSIINSPNVVAYNANICIEMTAGFETVIGADFTAEILDPCM